MSPIIPAECSPFKDKDFDTFTPTLDPISNDLFDQFVYHDSDPFDSSDNSNGSYLFDHDFAFDMPQSCSSSGVGSSSSKSSNNQPTSIHTWRADSWRPHKVVAAPPTCQKLVHRMRPEGLAISGSELLSLEGKAQTQDIAYKSAARAPETPPITPSRQRMDRAASTPFSPAQEHRAGRIPSDFSTDSPSIMHPSCYNGLESPSTYEWTGRFQQFSLQIPPNDLPMLPPPSTKAPQNELFTRLSVPRHMSESPFRFANGDSKIRRQSRMPARRVGPLTMQEEAGPDLFASQPRHSSIWTQGPEGPVLDPEFSLSSSQPQGDWLQESTQAYHPTNPASTDFTSMPSDFSTGGLMIQCDSFDDLLPPSSSVSTNYFDPATSATNPLDTYSPAISLGTSYPYRIRRPHTPPSPSRSFSPPSTPPSRTSRRASSKPTTPSSSRHYSGPNRRSKSSPHSAPRTPNRPSLSSTPTPNPSTSTADLGFVNFTPSDSKRILTGVAPSGSSKTKARREKEAYERRRRLSEAAARAVREAGGDVESLREWGVLG